MALNEHFLIVRAGLILYAWLRQNPPLQLSVVAIGEFNTKSKSWYFNDSTASHGNVLKNMRHNLDYSKL